MARFVQLSDAERRVTIEVNPEHVVLLRSFCDGSYSCQKTRRTMMILVTGEVVIVEGQMREVVEKLSG
jgi:hypothetical protein